jgi:FtsP/CotA-like multicopper oxidase with cupredoxin domain
MPNRNHRRILAFGFIFAMFWVGHAAGSTLNKQVLQVVDINPDSSIFEAELSAVENPVIIDGQYVETLVYRDENNTTGAYDLLEDGTPQEGIPVPQIVVDVGDEVWVKFNNRLTPDCSAIACHSSIHWHGIELDNDSDGTGVTQNHVEPGESYIYRFIAPRPGIFWFHPHMLPGPQTFAGMYGAFIVRSPEESELQASGLIPGNDSTHTLVLSDIEFDSPAGNVGFLKNGVTRPWARLKTTCEDPAGDVVTRNEACQAVQDGMYPLVNGFYSGSRPVAPIITARQGEGIRLRLINTSTNRYFRLRLEGQGSDTNLYRIGGEGGFLERVRLEGGVLSNWDTKYDRGEIVIPASARSDVVLVAGADPNMIMTIVGEAYHRGGPAGKGSPKSKPAGDLLYISFNEDSGPEFVIAEGDAVLGDGSIEDLKALGAAELDALLDPPEKPDGTGPQPGTTNDTIRLDVLGRGVMAINGTPGHFEDSGDDYRMVPYQGATRYAKTGDLLELTVKNCNNSPSCEGGQHHPFHLHGFSFQPVKVIDNVSGDTLFEYDYTEYQDVIDVFDGQSLVFRTRLEDRPIITDTRQEPEAPEPNVWLPGGGAQGRWVYHCHLFLHAALGMISELVVVPTPVAVCKDTTIGTDPGQCSASDVSIDDNSFALNGEDFSLSQEPPQPYPLGQSEVRLLATGEDGKADSCMAIVTVEDNEAPTITAPADIVAECNAPGGRDDVDLGGPTTSDNCPSLFTTPFGPDFYSLGENVVKWRVTDGNGNSAQDNQRVTVSDTHAPTISCNAPEKIAPFNVVQVVTASATDICDPDIVPKAVSFDCYAFTNNGRRQDRTRTCEIVLNGPSVEIVDSGGLGATIEWTVEATDVSGNTNSVLCSTEVVKPKDLVSNRGRK